ncbi:MAG: ATP synthase F0 subunit B [Deltaproteobacteria bacterium]|nr:ATP synthase F0 subunit B [Deltaproteobacteria bacterium]
MRGRFQEYWSRRPFQFKSAFPGGASWRMFSVPAICLAQLFLFQAIGAASEGAEGGEGGRNWADFGWRFFNFIVLAGFFYWLLAKKTKDFFSGRRDSLQTALAEAVVAKDEAAKKLRESVERLEQAAGEISDATDSIRTQGLKEKERIIADARKTAEKMKDDARKRLEQEFRKASNLLKAEAVDLSLKMSEEILKKNIGAQDHNAMVKDYIDKVLAEGRSPKQ